MTRIGHVNVVPGPVLLRTLPSLRPVFPAALSAMPPLALSVPSPVRGRRNKKRHNKRTMYVPLKQHKGSNPACSLVDCVRLAPARVLPNFDWVRPQRCWEVDVKMNVSSLDSNMILNGFVHQTELSTRRQNWGKYPSIEEELN